jgi:putative acetyltransferase
MATVDIRDERPKDAEAIRVVNDRAFGGDAEGRIVDALRADGALTLSLVATVDGVVVGHIAFSPVEAATGVTGSGLAPVAVLPEHQRRGLGSALIEAGLTRLATSDAQFVVVLGHPEYYPRFGFEPASRHGMRCEWNVPDDTFMIRVFRSAPEGVSGLARYRPEFSAAETGGA